MLHALSAPNGIEAVLMTHGATLKSLRIPDKSGRLANVVLGNVVLGYDSPEEYATGKAYFGATVGRYANRIAGGRFTLNGRPYQLSKNEGSNHLHGGLRGFDKREWSVKHADAQCVEFEYISADGEEGYPGNMTVRVQFSLDPDALKIEYEATSDLDTIVNLTNHSYFNLAGTGDILDHELMMNAGAYTPVDNALIPTGEIRRVEGRCFDFREPTVLRSRITETGGFDHNFALESGNPAVVLRDPASGRVMEIHTDQPAIQFYTGNYLKGRYSKYGGLCLEPQHFPDSPNHPNFPSTVLRAGEHYRTATIYRFRK